MIKNILKNSLITLSLLSTPALADYSFESEVNYDVQIEKIRFQALLRIGQTVTVGELLEFTNGPRVTYDEVPDGNMRSLLKKMKRGVKDEDVAHYFWDFFQQNEIIALTPDEFKTFLESNEGEEFIEKFDDFIKTDDDDLTAEIIYSSLIRSYDCAETCSLSLVDVITNIEGTRKITAYLMKIKSEQEFYESMIKNLKIEAESYIENK